MVATNGERDASGRLVTWTTAPVSATAPTGQTLAQYYQSALVGEALAFMPAADGRATDNARSSRANMKAFGTLNSRVQVNGRNLLNEDDPVPIAAHTTGAIVKIATVEPRVIVLTLAVDF